MSGADARSMLHAEISRFDSELRELAWAFVRTIVAQERDRRISEKARAEPTRRSAKRAAPPPPPAPPPTASPAQLELLPALTPAPAPEAQAGEPAPKAEPEGKTSSRWTRESVVNELVKWLVSGTTVDAAFLTRHGPRGLVAAARRIFGRFDAALNVASLEIARLYPEGPPATLRNQAVRRRSTP